MLGQLVGTIDSYQDGQLAGWAWNPRDWASRLSIDAFVDGQARARFTADSLREDLIGAGIGDGRYAYFLPLCDLVNEDNQFVDLRFADTGEQLAHSPVRLADTLWSHRKRLRGYLNSSPFIVSDFRFDGQYFEVWGIYHPLHGDVSNVSFEANGAAPAELVWIPPDDRAKREFWFLGPNNGGFQARFAAREMANEAGGIVRLKLIDPIGPLNDLRIYVIPTSISDYQNLPSPARQRRVLGWVHDMRFVFLGRTHHEINRRLAERYGLPPVRIKKMLDLGVGCGRIARHFLAQDPFIELHGVDIDEDNIRWCAEHLPRGHFRRGPLIPPLPYRSGTFDFIHANSVFTHLTEENQDLWLTEISRILSPNGIAVITYHGETAVAYARMSSDWLDRWSTMGIDAIGANRDLAGFIADDNYYRNTYHATSYIREHWASHVDLLGFHDHVFGYQDAVVVRSRRSPRFAPSR